ncbi:MAG: hypothetical protein ACHQVS_05545 [Candidatus Babeliales bacterium]
MKKTLRTLAILVVLVIIGPLSARADFVDLLIDTATLHTDIKAVTLSFEEIKQNDSILIDSHRLDIYQINSVNKSASVKYLKSGGYSNPTTINGAIQTTLTTRDRNAALDFASLKKNPINPVNYTAHPMPDDSFPSEFSVDTHGICGLSTSVSANLGSTNLAEIIWSRNRIRDKTLIISNGINSGETKIYYTPFTEFAMVKNALEPGTMLLLGSCLLGLGLFALKFRK